jgi:hypothetical protein
MADGYLKAPLLSLPSIEEDSNNEGSFKPNSSVMTGISKTTDFLSKNKEQAKSFNPYKKPMICD